MLTRLLPSDWGSHGRCHISNFQAQDSSHLFTMRKVANACILAFCQTIYYINVLNNTIQNILNIFGAWASAHDCQGLSTLDTIGAKAAAG